MFFENVYTYTSGKLNFSKLFFPKSTWLRILIQVTTIALFSAASTAVFWLKREHELSDLEWSTPQYGLGADPSRFLLQAVWLSEGFGFRETNSDGRLCTSLPPGHPFILSFLLYVTKNLDHLRILQSVVPFLSGCLLFFALRHEHWLRFPAALITASSPWITSLSSCHMSETTSTLLASIFVALISLLPFRKLAEENTTSKPPQTGATGRSTNYSYIRNFFIGLLAVASVLTAPGLIFPIVTISIMLLISNFRRGPDLLALIIGLLIPFLGWEYHCYLAEGKVVPMLLTSLDKNTRIEKEWVLTWARSPEETLLGFNEFAWNADDDFTGVPEHAFRTEKEKLSIVESYRKQAGAKNTEETERTANERRHLISEITVERRRNDALQYYILLPIARGTLSWINQQPIGFQNHESLNISARLLPWNFLAEIRQYGLFRATLRSLRGTIGIFAIVTHWGSIAMIIYCFFRSYRISHLNTLILAASLLAFTYMHGLAGPECRRNLPFLPIFFGLPAIVTALDLQKREKSEFANI